MITAMPRIAIAVDDFPAIVSTFADKLGMPVVDLSSTSGASLGANLAMCVPAGGSNIELMAPADPNAPLSQSLQSFLDRRGEGLFALMLEAPDPNAEADALAGRGLNVLPLMAGAGGRDVHPNSTHGVLIRVYPANSYAGPADVPPAADSNPTGLSGIARVIIAVNDLDHAARVYGQQFQMPTNEITTDTERGVRAAICHPPSGGAIELVSVDNPSRPFANSIQAFLDGGREGMYALVLQSNDLDASARALAARGVAVSASADSPDVLEIDRAATFGALLRIESA
ncbi:MAG: VOC family protein [Gammaproteobacteria bacterium]|nr:VOC family protein [Gammaproteobacteria bacterium]